MSLRSTLPLVVALAVPSVAAQAVYAPALGTVNPLGRLDLVAEGTPALADLDGDGRLDLVVAYAADYVPERPAAPWLIHRGTQGLGADLALLPGEPFEAFDTLPIDAGEGVLSPAFGDLDGDGDLDLVVASLNGTANGLRAFRNDGTATAPRFVRYGMDPTSGVAGALQTVTMGDLDGDGDLDLVLGRLGADGLTRYAYAENQGDAAGPWFVERGAGPFAGAASVLLGLTPALLDLDDDGDLDLATFETGFDDEPRVVSFLNTGTASAPAFRRATVVENPFQGFAAEGAGGGAVAAADVDGDGRRDLLVLSADVVQYSMLFVRQGAGFEVRYGVGNPFATLGFDGLGSGAAISPFSAGDLDGDGDLDLVIGGGEVRNVIRNVGSATAPALRLAPDRILPTPFDESAVMNYDLADLDGDGRADLVVTASSEIGELGVRSFRNAGGSFTALTGAADPFAAFAALEIFDATFADLDGDGDLDAILATFSPETPVPSRLILARNVGTPTAPSFQDSGIAMPTFGARRVLWPALGDVDGDGALDLVVGEVNINSDDFATRLRVFLGDGATGFAEATGAANPLAGIPTSFPGTPTLFDIDGDGDLDFLLGTGIDFEADFPELTTSLYLNDGGSIASEAVPTTRGFSLRYAGAHPARGRARLAVQGGRQDVSVEVFDGLGRRVAQVEASAETVDLDVSQWAPGRYIVRASSGSEVTTLPMTVVR